MQLEKIITLANAKTRLLFLAMERSLRAVDCTLPLWVIPYDEKRFDLPPNAHWWEIPDITEWIKTHNLHPFLKKLQCFTNAAYQFVDTDVIFLRNPEKVLAPHTGFITCCGHWHNAESTCTAESLALLKAKSTTWQKHTFNAGQFACDQILYTFENLKEIAQRFPQTCLPPAKAYYSDQPALNLLLAYSKTAVKNLSLVEPLLESSWAGDYTGEDFEKYWKTHERIPYILHWAGQKMSPQSPISRLFFQYLSQAEKEEYVKTLQLSSPSFFKKTLTSLRVAKNAFMHSFCNPS